MSAVIDKPLEHSRYRVDLAAYMRTCDANYSRLLTLVPALESGVAGSAKRCHNEPLETDEWEFLIGSGEQGVGKQSGRPPIRIRLHLLEAFPYTSTIEIQVQSGFPAWSPAPVIVVRMYHDARTAEPVSYQGHRRIPARCAIPNTGMYHQDEKRQINEFLAEWLRLCLNSGISARTADFLCIE